MAATGQRPQEAENKASKVSFSRETPSSLFCFGFLSGPQEGLVCDIQAAELAKGHGGSQQASGWGAAVLLRMELMAALPQGLRQQ